MQISEKKQIPLSIEKSQLYQLKHEKIVDRKLTIDLKVIEDNEINETSSICSERNNANSETISPCFDENLGEENKNRTLFEKTFSEVVYERERKGSTCSTSISKVDDFSEFNFSFPKKNNSSTPMNNKEKEKEKASSFVINSFFGRENKSTPVSNFYRETEEYLRGLYFEEYREYNKSKNYKKKEDFLEKEKYGINSCQNQCQCSQDFSENSKIDLKLNINLNDSLSVSNCNTPTTSSFPSITNVPAVIGAITPKFNSWGKGKFDLPMYYLGFYSVDMDNNKKQNEDEKDKKMEEKEENIKKKSETNDKEVKEKEKENSNFEENKEKEKEAKDKTMMVAIPFFMLKPQKFCFNKLFRKKPKPFTERTGDWICKNCKNLNFAFRVECNRCHLPKGEAEEIVLEDKNSKEKSKEEKQQSEKNDTNENRNQKHTEKETQIQTQQSQTKSDYTHNKTSSSQYQSYTPKYYNYNGGYNFYKHKKKYGYNLA